MKNYSYLLSRKRWFVFDILNKFKQNSELIIFKLYAIRDANNKWNILSLPKSTLEDGANGELNRIFFGDYKIYRRLHCAIIILYWTKTILSF